MTRREQNRDESSSCFSYTIGKEIRYISAVVEMRKAEYTFDRFLL